MTITINKTYVLAAVVLLLAVLFNLAEVFVEDEAVGLVEFFLDTLEKSFLIIGAGGVLLMFKRMNDERYEKIKIVNELKIAREEGGDWRKKAHVFIKGMSDEIDKQFSEWGLTGAEIEVGLMIIKGLSHKEIANLRGSAEATVRQQARNIYKKSGLPGKAAFSAYFLEDLLLPIS